MTVPYTIGRTTGSDLDFVCRLFEEAIRFQKENNFIVWSNFDIDVLKNDIENKQQYKIVIENQTAIIFTVFDADPLIWRERDKADAVYLHRIVVNPAFRGMKLLRLVLEYAEREAKERNRKFVRLDTWGNNPKMIAYYESFGFRFIEFYRTADTPELPVQHRNLYVALLQYEIK